MKQLTLLLLFAFMGLVRSYAQHPEEDKHTRHCGYSESYMKELNDPDQLAAYNAYFKSVGSKFTAGPAVMTCGRFQLFFEDVSLGLGTGFDDPVNGAALRQCMCDVANYVQSVFRIPTGDGSPIEILVQQSSVGFAWDVLAVGGPVMTTSAFTSGTPGFYGGNTFEHFTTGNDPDAGNIDGAIRVNFGQPFRMCNQPRNCNLYDLYSVLLHEFSHVLGWFSNVGISGSTYASIYAANQFSKYDQFFLYHGNIKSGPAMQKLVNTAGPSINPAVPSGALTGAQLWIYGHKRDNATLNQNVPAFANPGYFGSGTPPGTSSHLGDYQTGFMDQGYEAPGFVPNYVMAPSFWPNQVKDVWTDQELRMFRTMGYSFQSSFMASHSYITSNRHPYTTKEIYDYNSWNFSGGTYQNTEMDMNSSSYTPADATISNCSSVVFKLSSDPKIKDADGDPIRIYPGSLYNIRGTGVGGNNHNGLTVTSTAGGDEIKYNPRPDFIGRAQFGFHLYDGKEKGEFMIYTIDVTGCNTCGSNLVVNGNFEEGQEVKTMANPTVDNASRHFYRNRKYEGLFSLSIPPDGVIYNATNALITKDADGCTQSDGEFGSPGWSTTSTYYGIPMSTALPGTDRFYAPQESNTYFRLCSSPATCTRYVLEFDIYTNIPINMDIGFTNNPLAQPGPIALVNASSHSFPTNPTWQHVVIPITYCASAPSNFLVFQATGSFFGFPYFVDNLNLHLDPVNPTFAVSVTPATAGVCMGTVSTPTVLSAVVSNPKCSPTYLWMPGGATTSSISVSPASLTTYTLTVNDGCSSASGNATVGPKPLPVITASASPASVCALNPTSTLSASGGVSYVWNPGGIPGNSVNVTPGSTTTYTVTGTGSNGCTNTASVTVSYTTCAACTNCTPLSGTIGSGSYSSNNFCIGSNLVITGNVTVIGSEFQISPAVTIIIMPGASLDIINSHFYGCSKMWQGIVVQDGGTLNISGSMIEDADEAVVIRSNTQTVPVLNVNASVFNRNYIGINISSYSQIVSPYPFSITNTVFTCRDIPFTPNSMAFPSWTTVAAAAANPGFPLDNAFINNAIFLENGVNAELKAPLTGTKSYAAINLKDVGVTLNPTMSAAYFDFVLGGPAAGNIIDNQYFGINAYNSNVVSIGNTFQNAARYYGTMGVGINTDSDPKQYRRLIADATPSPAGGNDINRFVNCGKGIWSLNGFEYSISGCDFRSTQQGPLHLNTTNTEGEYGIYINTYRYENCYIGFNELYNIKNGIVVIADGGAVTLPGAPGGTQQYANMLYLNNNIIRAHLPGYAVVNEFVSNAIILDNAFTGGTPYAPSIPYVRAENNQLTDVYRGISITNWNKHDVMCRWNVITLNDDQDMSAGLPRQYGINGENCDPSSSSGHYFVSNTIIGTGTNNTDAYGIYMRNNQNTNVWCNITDKTYTGIEFEGKSLWTVFERNKMSNHKYGFVLLNNGEIGQQGSPSQPQDNEWLGSNGVMTATINSSALNSPFYIRTSTPGSSYNPDGFGFTSGTYGWDDYSLSTSAPTLILSAATPPPQNCLMYGKSTAVEEKTKTGRTFDASLFPNPGTGHFNISLTGLPEGEIEVTVVDITGKLIYHNDHHVSRSAAQIDIDAATGAYFCKIINKQNNSVLIKKLMIRK